MLDKHIIDKVLVFQRNEITEHCIYKMLSEVIKDKNKEVLQRISNDELRHYNTWKKYSQQDVKPDRFKIWKYFLIAKFLGLTFGVKLMEKGEENAQVVYENISPVIPEAMDMLMEPRSGRIPISCLWLKRLMTATHWYLLVWEHLNGIINVIWVLSMV